MEKEQEIDRSAGVRSLEREKPLSGVFATASNRRQQRNINVVRGAVENGDFWKILTEKQQVILRSRGYLKEGQLISIKKLEEVRNGKLTFQAISDIERRALSWLSSPEERGVRSRTRMKPREKEVIRNNPHLSARQLAQMLGHGPTTIGHYKDLAGVPRNSIGCPKKEMSPEIRIILLNTRHLSTNTHSEMLGRSRRVVDRWREELGIGKNPVGRPRRHID